MSFSSHKTWLHTISICLVPLLVSCGDGDTQESQNTSTDTNNANANLVNTTVVSKKMASSELYNKLKAFDATASQLLKKPKCDIKVVKIRYATKGSLDEAGESTGAIMMPVGDAPECNGKRPLVLHAHGTAVNKNYDLSQLGNPDNEAGYRGALVAAMFTAQGYIVIAPNYIGYGGSSIDYGAYLNAKQQSNEMVDALTAGRKAIANMTTEAQENGQLFLTGYSQGGYVTLATARNLQNRNIAVTAAVPMSGPYAMAAFGDALFSGNVSLGATIFGPMIAKSYQKAYGNLYQKPSDIYTDKYLKVNDALPSNETFEALSAKGIVPLSALFQKAPTSNPLLDAVSPKDVRFSFGFDANDYLIKTSYRTKFLLDALQNPDGLVPTPSTKRPNANPLHPFRKALAINDLRGYVPNMPMMLCGGNQDLVSFYDINTGSMASLWKDANAAGGKAAYAKLDVDITNKRSNTYESENLPTQVDDALKTKTNVLQKQFVVHAQAITKNATKIAYDKAIKAGLSEADAKAKSVEAGQVAFLRGYHGMVAPYCVVAASTFFEGF